MIRFLSIQHLAVIDRLELELEAGLNVLTGETGAGKSIVVEALGLLVGDRASPDLVRTGETRAVIQASIETPEGREILVRREISAQGRSRAFIDDELVTSNALKELGSRLVDLHGQHEHQALLDPRSHVDVLDEHAGLSAERAAVAVAFDRWRSVRAELERVRTSEREQAARVELLAFQLGELERAAPQLDEDQELGATRQILANAERLQRLCSEGYVELYEGDEAVLARLEGLWRRLSELAALDPKFTPYLEVRESVKPQLEDLAFFLRSYGSAVEASPERLQHVEDRLALLERLKKKYGPSLSDVIARLVALENELEAVSTAAERVAGLEQELGEATGAYVSAAETLSRARRTAAQTLASKLERLLAELAMERSRLEVRFNGPAIPEGEWTERGRDGVEFYFSANPGEDLQPLAKIASGGELSRVMLALKTLASTDVPGKTLIFDEVDAGIGGRVAESVGYKLNGLGAKFQVVCVTHLPQIAAYGVAHYHVSKSVRRGRTITRVDRLTGEARVEEIGRLMTGGKVLASARASARELLAATGEAAGEQKTKGESERAKAKG